MIFYEEILREFNKQKIKYILVGGVAFNLLGGIRTTHDLDILVEMTDANLKKIVTTLKRRNYYVKQPVDPMGIADGETREDWIKNKHMKAFNFYKGNGEKEVDLIIDSPISFKKAKKSAVYFKIDKMRLPVISVDNLITMKKRSGREIDKFDLKQLKQIKRLCKKK